MFLQNPPLVINHTASLIVAARYIAFQQAPLISNSCYEILNKNSHKIYGKYDDDREHIKIPEATDLLAIYIKGGNLEIFHDKESGNPFKSHFNKVPPQEVKPYIDHACLKHNLLYSYEGDPDYTNIPGFLDVYIDTVSLFKALPPENPEKYFAQYENGRQFLIALTDTPSNYGKVIHKHQNENKLFSPSLLVSMKKTNRAKQNKLNHKKLEKMSTQNQQIISRAHIVYRQIRSTVPNHGIIALIAGIVKDELKLSKEHDTIRALLSKYKTYWKH